MKPGTGFFMKFPVSADSKYIEQYKLVDDKGRFEVTGKAHDTGMWKVPTLRNVALTAPYFHNGSVKRLDEAVRVMAGVQLNKELDSTQTGDIVAFLYALTGEFPKQVLPQLPPTPGRSIVDP